MTKRYIFVISIFLLIVIIGIIIWKVLHVSSSSNRNSSLNQQKPLPKESTIILDKNGFSPNRVTIKVGSAVRWINKSGKPEMVNSDNYPTNQLHKELNFGEFADGSSVVYTFIKPGTYGYHNQFHHEQAGKVIVAN